MKAALGWIRDRIVWIAAAIALAAVWLWRHAVQSAKLDRERRDKQDAQAREKAASESARREREASDLSARVEAEIAKKRVERARQEAERTAEFNAAKAAAAAESARWHEGAAKKGSAADEVNRRMDKRGAP